MGGLARSVLRRAGEPGWLAAAAAAYALQEAGISHLHREGFEGDLRRICFFATTAAVVLLALHFRRYIGAWLIAAGILMNFAPMALHGGLMPVSYEVIADSGAFPEITPEDIGNQAANSKDIVLERADIQLEPLSDRYFLAVPGYGPNIFSLGDFVAFAGVLLAAGQVVLGIFVPVSRTKERAAV
ncbi:MAG: DUF5317 family protein [Hyphomicrobiales bacterium]